MIYHRKYIIYVIEIRGVNLLYFVYIIDYMTMGVYLHQLSVTSSQQKETLDIESTCTNQNQSLSYSGSMQMMKWICFDGKRVQ